MCASLGQVLKPPLHLCLRGALGQQCSPKGYGGGGRRASGYPDRRQQQRLMWGCQTQKKPPVCSVLHVGVEGISCGP